MTRATVIVYSLIQGIKFVFGKHSDGYPAYVVPELKSWDGTIESLRNIDIDCTADGNFSYWYELNANTGNLTVWESQIYWRNAPADWKTKGWNCWVGKNGKYGWTEWRKGKKVYNDKFYQTNPTTDTLNIQILQDTRYTSKDLKDFRDFYDKDHDVQGLTMHWKNPNLTKTFVSVNKDLYDLMYVDKLEDLPTMLDKFHHDWIQHKIFSWRLKIGK